MLRNELSAPRYKAAVLALGTNTDPYQPCERDHGITRAYLEVLLAAGAEAGADAASWIMLRLPREVSGLWQEWLDKNEPGRAAKVMARLREMHGGRDYDPRWGHRMRGEGRYAEMIAQRFKAACRRIGLKERTADLRCDLFARSPQPGDQLALF